MNAEQDLLPFAQREMTDAQWRERIAAPLDVLAFNSRPCKARGRKVWFTKNKSGKFGAALRIMATARATAAETLRKEATKHEQKKPARRSTQVDSESNRHPHPAERQQPRSLSASSRP